MQTEILASAERLTEKFLRPEALGTRNALGDSVVPAIDIQENRLFRSQSTRSGAGDVHHAIAVRLDAIVT